MARIETLSEAEMLATIERDADYFRTMLLYGPPGTGKSHTAMHAGNPRYVYPITIHEDMPAAELRGHFMPTQSDNGVAMRWHDGPATMAWRHGGRLILNEIDKAGSDGLSYLLGVLDNEESARMVLGTTGEILAPAPGFSAWATMNAELDDLPPALKDRFPVAVRITQPHPAAIARLPREIQPLARDLAQADDDRRIGLRSWLEYTRLTACGMPATTAGQLVFGSQWRELAEAIEYATIADPR